MTVRYCDADLGTGDNDGTSWANAYQTLQAAADNAVAGDIVYCQGTDSISAQIDFDTNSGTYDGGYIKFIGVKDGTTNAPPQSTDYATAADRAVDADAGYFVINGQDNSINGLAIAAKKMLWFENFKVHSCDGTAGIYTSGSYPDDNVFINVWSTDNSGHGISGTLRFATFFRCKFSGNGGDGCYRPGSQLYAFASEFNNNGGDGCDAYGAIFGSIGCLYHGNGAYGIDTQTKLVCMNCVFDGNASAGVRTNNSLGEMPMFIGCRFTNQNGSGDLGLTLISYERAMLIASYFGNNATDVTANKYDILPIDGSTSHVVLGGTDTDGTNGELLGGYKDIGSDDFNLKDTATLRSQAIELP